VPDLEDRVTYLGGVVLVAFVKCWLRRPSREAWNLTPCPEMK